MGDGNVGKVVFGPARGVGKAYNVERALEILRTAEKERIEVAQKEADRHKCAECEDKDAKISLLVSTLECYADLGSYPMTEFPDSSRPQEYSRAMVRNMEAIQRMTLKARAVLAEVGKSNNG